MRLIASATLRNRVLGVSAVLLLFVIAGYAAVFVSIHGGVTDAARAAMTQYPGDRVQALCSLVDCQTCSLAERKRAVWALGQLRDPRALPILMKYYTRQQCDHASDVCQHELQKAVEAIQRTYPLWLGYRDLATR
ncbi:MAG: hypothetical protein HY820_15690 [Acidobacteria bacterium]|nr:hypothetical protein [Acidobacteriota bacterium]